jgi:outer membrane protein TolC
LSIGQAVDLAVDRDANADRAQRSSDLAALQVADARANCRPNADVNVAVNQSATGSTYRADDLAFRQGLEGNFVGTVTASVSMPVDISGSIGRQVKAARINADLAKLSLSQAQINAVIDVQIAYLTALAAQQQAKVDASLVASIEQLKARAGKDLPGIVPFLDVELANARDTAAASRATADQSQDALKLQLRLPLSTELDLTTPLAALAVPGASALQARTADSPDVVMADRRLDAASLAVEQAKDPRRPSLQLGGYATQTFGGRFIDEAGRTTNRDYGLTMSLNLPLINYDAGRNKNSVRASKLLADQARADLETAKLTADLGVRQAQAALKRATTRLNQLPDVDAAANALAAATNALFAAPPETAPGLLAQVSNARSSWRSAQAAVADAKVGALIATLRLARAFGQPLLLQPQAAG